MGWKIAALELDNLLFLLLKRRGNGKLWGETTNFWGEGQDHSSSYDRPFLLMFQMFSQNISSDVALFRSQSFVFKVSVVFFETYDDIRHTEWGKAIAWLLMKTLPNWILMKITSKSSIHEFLMWTLFEFKGLVDFISSSFSKVFCRFTNYQESLCFELSPEHL